MEKKCIDVKTAVKALINGFIAYGVLITFIFLAVIVFVSWQINQYKEYIDYDTLKYSLPIIAAILAFFLVRLVCRLSTYDLFKKCRIEKEDVDKVATRMNLFFIGCVVFSVILILIILTVRFNNQKINIQQTVDVYYSQYSKSFADYLTLEMISDFQMDRAITLIQVIIVEFGLLFGIFSLTGTQRFFIQRYNFVEKKDKKDESDKQRTVT